MSSNVRSDNPPPKSRFNFRTKEAIMFYILISPFIAMLILMKLFPFIWGVIMSFTNFTGFNYDNLKFIGFNNYVRVLTDNFAIQSLQATAVIGRLMLIENGDRRELPAHITDCEPRPSFRRP